MSEDLPFYRDPYCCIDLRQNQILVMGFNRILLILQKAQEIMQILYSKQSK